MRKTKILCTLGPSSNDPQTIGRLLDAGMDAVRLNFSHGDHAAQAATIEAVHAAARERDRGVPIVADLQGPKVRTGRLEGGGPIAIKAGDSLRLTSEQCLGNATRVSIDYPSLAQDVKPGFRILLADGAVQLRVEKIDGEDVLCEVLNDGNLGERKGVNVPEATMRLPSITAKDKADLEFALEQGVEYIAQSFVRRSEDVRLCKSMIEWSKNRAHVIAKIEKPQALDDLDGILEFADGVMVARGDLGVELNPWQVPIAQKHIIEEAARWRKPVITATQMLESMIDSPSPTRAEASDVANAVFDGTDAVMLSGETAAGKFPVEAVAMMDKIVRAAEENLKGAQLDLPPAPKAEDGFSMQVAHSAARLAEQLQARYIVVYTQTGFSARLISKHRPTCPVLALSANTDVCRRAKLLWGVRARQVSQVQDLDELVEEIERLTVGLKWVERGDVLLIVAGTPFRVQGRTDLIKLHRIGE
jgi:pyruvate kinase